jgi:hypothetical protein
MAALTGGVAVNSVTLQAKVVGSFPGNQQTGTMTLQSSGVSNSQVSITVGSTTTSESRSSNSNGPTGQWTDANGVTHPMAQHNCWTDAAWFFPALSMLARYSDPNFVFNDLGQETHRGKTVEHLRVYRTASTLSPADARTLAKLSVTDYYLDSATALPLAVFFFTHADDDMGTSIPVEIVFTSYQPASQDTVAYQITKYFNGTQLFQISITNVQVQ